MKSEDVAKLAGVSRSTVSRVINNYSNVPEETRQRVMSVIEKYNYQPNNSARVLAGKGINTIGLFVVSIADKHNPNRIYQNNYFAPFVDAVVDTANALGYYVLIHTVYSEKDYLKVKSAFFQKRIDCGIIVGTEKDAGMVTEVIDAGFPIALIDYHIAQESKSTASGMNMAVINSQDFEGTVSAIEYLIDLGHRDIGIIRGRMNTHSGRQRFEAYRSVLKKHRLKSEKEFVIKGEFLKNTAYREVGKLIKSARLPTAIFSSSDDMAIGAMEAFKECGIKVPSDISIVSFDDVPVASQIMPALTTVRVPVYDMAKKAVELLINNIEKKDTGISYFNFPTELIVRETCARRISRQ